MIFGALNSANKLMVQITSIDGDSKLEVFVHFYKIISTKF